MENKELAIVKYIKKYGLEKAIEDFALKFKDYPSKILIKYDQLCGPTMMANQEVQDCRGVVLEKGTWEVMSLAFQKFFNSDESNAHKVDWETARVLEKLDGSLVQVYYDWNKMKWYAGTTGTAEGEGEVNNKMGTTFNELFWKTVYEKYNLTEFKLEFGYTYVFELTTPYNIVVKPHGESSATLLTVRSLHDLKELSFEDVSAIATGLGVPMVKEFDLSARNVGTLLNTFKNMVWTEEGYVVVDANFNRIKIKNPAYVAVHHLKGKTAEHNIIAIVKTNEIEEFASTFPDRKEELVKLKDNYDKLVNHLNEGWEELKERKPKNITPAEKKKYAQAVFEVCEKRKIKNFTGLYFGLNDGKISSVEDFIFNYDNKTLYNIL